MKNPSPPINETVKEPKQSLTSSQMTSSEQGSTMSKRDRLKAQKLLRKFQGEEPDPSPPSQSTQASEEPTTSAKKKASVFSFFRTKTSWGPELRMLIAGEFLFQYVRESAIHILQTSYADKLGLHPLDSFFLIELQLYAGSLLGFLIGWISDALLSQYTIMVISLLFYSIVPSLCSIASIPTIGRQSQKISLIALRYTFAIFTLAGGTRLAFLFSQDVSFEKNVVSSGFIFWCICVRFLAKLIFSSFSMIPYETIFLLFNGFLIAISSIIYVGAFFIMKSQMVRTTPYYRLVNQTIYYAFFNRFCSLFQNILPKRIEKRPAEKIGLHYAKNSGKQLSIFTFVFLPYIGYGTVNFLLQKLYFQQFKLLYSGKYVSVALFYLPLDNLLTTSFLLAARYLLQPLYFYTSKYLKLTRLRAILISYLMLGGSLLWAYGIQLKIESLHSTPTLKLAKVFFYNAMLENLTLKSEYFSTVVTPKELYIADVETQETKKTQIEYYVKNVTKKVEIEIVKAAGVSYTIGENGIRRIQGTVPINSAPLGSNLNGHPITYALPIEKGIDGDLIVYNSESIETFVSMEYTENRKFFRIKGGYYTAQFASINSKNNTETEIIKLCIGGVYSFAIYPLPELSVNVYHITKPVSMSEFLILPGMIMRSLSIALGLIPLFEFTHSQSPPHTISILMSYVIFLQYGGCGIALWTQGIDYYGSLLNTSEEILIHIYILFGSFVLFTGLVFIFYKSKLI